MGMAGQQSHRSASQCPKLLQNTTTGTLYPDISNLNYKFNVTTTHTLTNWSGSMNTFLSPPNAFSTSVFSVVVSTRPMLVRRHRVRAEEHSDRLWSSFEHGNQPV